MLTVFRGGKVITGKRGDDATIDRGVIVVRDDKIEAVGREGDIPTPGNPDQEVDVKGRTILPGLIDAHTHILTIEGQLSGPLRDLNNISPQAISISVVQACENMRRMAQAGVTTARDLGASHYGIFSLRQLACEGRLLGPRIQTCGIAITMTGGHGYGYIATEADGEDEVRKAARTQLKMGADLIKVMATAGAGTPGEEISETQLSTAEMAAATEEAHQKGKHAAAHATHSDGARNALEAGVDTIEHGLLMDDDCVQRLSESGKYFIPTLEVYQQLANMRVAPSSPSYYLVRKGQEAVGPHRDSFQRALAAGVKVAAGTDAGSSWWLLGDLALEVERMVRYGLSPLEGVLAATRNAAEALQMLDCVGSLEPGKIADVVVAEGDPISDITALQHIAFVMKGGQIQIDNLNASERRIDKRSLHSNQSG